MLAQCSQLYCGKFCMLTLTCVSARVQRHTMPIVIILIRRIIIITNNSTSAIFGHISKARRRSVGENHADGLIWATWFESIAGSV